MRLLQHMARLKIKLRLLPLPAWASTATCFASALWHWLRRQAVPVIRRKIFLTAPSHRRASSKLISDSVDETRGGAVHLVAMPSLSSHTGCHSRCMSM
jgi:hypothetical protein